LKAGIEELRELAQGIHPAVLTETGLTGALPGLADRSAIPTVVTAAVDRRFAPSVEAAAYFVASEALANAAKHAAASREWITAEMRGDTLVVTVRDDGRGGAEPGGGSGLVGLADRVAALGGDLRIQSAPGAGTTVSAAIPVAESGLPRWSADPDAPIIGEHAHDAHR